MRGEDYTCLWVWEQIFRALLGFTLMVEYRASCKIGGCRFSSKIYDFASLKNHRQRNDESGENGETHQLIKHYQTENVRTRNTLLTEHVLFRIEYAYEGVPAGAVRQENEEVGLKTWFRLTLLTWINTSKESDARWFILNKFKHSTIWG